MFKKGDKVKVWSSLDQSLVYTEILNGEEAVVVEDPIDDEIILAVVRCLNGKYFLDKSYKTNINQCRFYVENNYRLENSYELCKLQLDNFREQLLSEK